MLKGEAARAVKGFPLTDVNYLHSVEILKERFGQTQKIVNAHMQSLLNLPTPRNALTDLRAFYDSIKSHIQGLSSLEITPDSYGALLIPITLGKSPARNLAREHNKSDWNIDCDVVVSTEKHLEHVKKEGLCFNCLGKHRISQCTSQSHYKKCKNKYHNSICGAESLQPTQRDYTTPSTETKSHVQKNHTDYY